MSKNGWFSTAQAPNPRPVSDVTNALQAINNKLDMILDALTKPAEKSEVKSTIDLFRAYDANTMQPVEFKPEEPKRLIGPPAKTQITRYIEQQPGGIAVFKKLAAAGFVSARIRTKPAGCPESHRYSHTVIIRDSASGRPKFEPTLFGITEAREVVAYLESLGVKVNTNALNRV